MPTTDLHAALLTDLKLRTIMKQTGDMAPDYLGLDQDGKEVRRSDFPGKTIALYFYPKDMTSGCTAEACSLRDGYSALGDKNIQVIGVSADSADRHKKFIEKNELPFPLIADVDHKLADEFGVWGEKSMYGRKYMGMFRTTFLIGPDGKIIRVFTPKEIKTKIHADQILAAES